MLVVFAILLVLPAAILGALHIVDKSIAGLMVSPSGMLLGVLIAYGLQKRHAYKRQRRVQMQQAQLQSRQMQPGLILDRQPDLPPVPQTTGQNVIATNSAIGEKEPSPEVEHNETDILLDQ